MLRPLPLAALALALAACDEPEAPVAGVAPAYGLGASDEDAWRDAMPSIPLTRFGVEARDLPSRVDWRDVGGESYVGPAKNQGGAGTCVAFAATGALEGALAVQAGTGGLDLSEQWLVNDCGTVSPTDGYSITAIGQDLEWHGMVNEADFAYTGEATGCPSGLDADPDYAVATAWRVEADELKGAPTVSPVLVRIDVYDDLRGYDDGVYRVGEDAEKIGGHALLLVGYDDEKKAWILRNSWGRSWGELGYFYLAYDDARSRLEYGILLEIAGGDPTRGPALLAGTPIADAHIANPIALAR